MRPGEWGQAREEGCSHYIMVPMAFTAFMTMVPRVFMIIVSMGLI